MKRGSKNIWLLGGSSLLNDVGSEMITPILPFLVTSMGGGGVAVGLLSGLREGMASLFKLIGGWLSDRAGKRTPFIFFGYFISVIFRFLLRIANSWMTVVSFISFERFGKLRDAPRDAVIAESTKKRGRGFGIHQTMDVIGGIIGTLLALFLFWSFNFKFKTIILIACFISLLSLIPLFFVKEPKTKPIKKDLFKGIKNLDSKLKYFIFVASVFTLANFGIYMFLLLMAEKITGSIAYALAIYVLFNFVWAVFAIPFGNFSDVFGRKRVLMTGYILFFIICIGFAFMDGLYSLIILFSLYGLVYAMTQSNQRAFVSDLSGKMKGTALGFYYMVIGLVNVFAGIVAGYLWNINQSLMFGYLAVVGLIAIILLGFVRENGR